MKRMLKTNLYSRRASVYVLVIGSSTLLAVIGLAALTGVRIQRKNLAGTHDFAEARVYAQSAVEIGMRIMTTDSEWRTNHSNGTWRTAQPMGNGTYSLEVVDPADSDLQDSKEEPVVITGIGMKGDAKHKVSVTLTSDQIGLSCLQVPLHTNGNITLTSVTAGPVAGVISSNGTITASSAVISCASEAVGAITGTSFSGSRTSPVPARTMPASSVFSYYSTRGTSIPISAIPYSTLPILSGVRTIERVLISSTSNPYGSTNSQGIYVINCGGSIIKIRECRIIGTLYVINPSSSSSVQDSVLMESTSANLPCLLVNGPIEINLSENSLSESSGSNANFNPVGTPYNGSTDGDTSDNYPSSIRGLVYVSGALNINGYLSLNGVIVAGGALSATGSMTLTYDNRFYNTPPPGFDNEPTLSILANSWRQSVN